MPLLLHLPLTSILGEHRSGALVELALTTPKLNAEVEDVVDDSESVSWIGDKGKNRDVDRIKAS